MADLVIELALVFLAATLIGWLMGRFLCKSGEYDERAARRRLERAQAGLGEALESAQETTDGLRRQLTEQTEAKALVEQERAGLQARLASLETEQAALLGKVGELEACNARCRGLEAALEAEQAAVLELRTTCSAQAQQIRELNGALDATRAELRAGDAEHAAQLAAIEQAKSRLDARLERVSTERSDCLARLGALADAVERLHERIRARGAPGHRRRSKSGDAQRVEAARDVALGAGDGSAAAP
jgi:chromosome segregation ATPase